MNPSIQALRDKLQQLRALHDSGTLGDEAYAQARTALERQLVDLVVADDAAAAPKPPRRLQLGLVVGVLVLAGIGYSITGAPGLAGFGPGMAAPGGTAVADGQDAEHPAPNEQQIAELVDRMAQRLAEKPDDAIGWALFARANAALGRYPAAVVAFDKAVALNGDDAGLRADYADTLAAQNNGKFGPDAMQQIERALALEPGNLKALALRGSAAFDRRDYAAAVRDWELVASGLPADSAMLPQVRASIEQARKAGGLPAAAPAAARPGGDTKVAGTAAAGASVSGRVSLSAALAAQAAPQDTVYVLARPASGPRMPLAVVRMQVKDLPASFTLDDSMAMAPGATISGQSQIVVTARVSRSGDAKPQPGDLFGESAPVAPGAAGVQVEIAQTVGN